MTAGEQRRAQVLMRLVAGELSQAEAATVLGLSVRQVRRLVSGLLTNGPATLAHGNRGRASPRRIPAEVRARVVALAQGRYVGFNHQHLTEKLAQDGVVLGRTTVRRILAEAQMTSPRARRPPRHRQRRARMPQAGMLLQADGSRHRWLGADHPFLTLVGGIDDATGTVPWAVFRAQEDAHGYLLWLEQVVRRCGIPQALYVDRHSIHQRHPTDPLALSESMAGGAGATQFGRAAAELGITLIHARSPQAKGRVERLWGTLQDRLGSELRLAQTATATDAQRVLEAFLPGFNARFATPPASPTSAYRPVPLELGLETVLCFKYLRVVGADNTVQFGEHRLQILPDAQRTSFARLQVEVHERLDGSIVVAHHGRCLTTQAAPPTAPQLRARNLPRPAATLPAPAPSARAPAASHPWRRYPTPTTRTDSPAT